MTKRTIEIEDTLESCVESAIEEVESELRTFIKENQPSDTPCLNNDLDYSGAIHEIVDGAVPIYTHEQKCAYFLYQDELDQAYEDAGIGSKDDAKDNYIPTAIYCYIQEQVNEWYHKNAEDIYQEYVDSGEIEYSEGDVIIWTHPETEERRKGVIKEFRADQILTGKILLESDQVVELEDIEHDDGSLDEDEGD